MNDILKHRAMVAQRISGQFSDIRKAEVDEIEKAKWNDGDMHPNGKWVWRQSANGGKGDWRVANKSSRGSKSSPEDGNKGSDKIEAKLANHLKNSGFKSVSAERAEKIFGVKANGSVMYWALDNGKELERNNDIVLLFRASKDELDRLKKQGVKGDGEYVALTMDEAKIYPDAQSAAVRASTMFEEYPVDRRLSPKKSDDYNRETAEGFRKMYDKMDVNRGITIDGNSYMKLKNGNWKRLYDRKELTSSQLGETMARYRRRKGIDKYDR